MRSFAFLSLFELCFSLPVNFKPVATASCLIFGTCLESSAFVPNLAGKQVPKLTLPNLAFEKDDGVDNSPSSNTPELKPFVWEGMTPSNVPGYVLADDRTTRFAKLYAKHKGLLDLSCHIDGRESTLMEYFFMWDNHRKLLEFGDWYDQVKLSDETLMRFDAILFQLQMDTNLAFSTGFTLYLEHRPSFWENFIREKPSWDIKDVGELEKIRKKAVLFSGAW